MSEEKVTAAAIEDALMRGLSQYLNRVAKRRGLKPLNWRPARVESHLVRKIQGQVGSEYDEKQAGEIVRAYAAEFGGSEPQVIPKPTVDTLETVFSFDGPVEVVVWGVVERRDQ